MYTTIIILPFIGAIGSGYFGRALGVRGVHIINVSCLLITTILAFVAYYEVAICNSPVTIELFSWINSEHLKISWSFYYDQLTVNMLIPVLIVSLLVHIYSIGYMGEDPHQQRFFSYISLFTGLMLVLVTGNNFLVMFLGWEGVGVCSYLLVHFWYTRTAAVKSALNAMFTNRVGDYFLTLGFFAIFFTFGTLDYATVFSGAPYINQNVITYISILLLLGAAAKSAQIGLHQWLPMAMEGPTPVSSLIHAATMVTAGVYLLIRCSPLLEQSDLALTIIMITGALTAFFAASVGLFQNDIKKVIAYSTMSQLGMMVIAVGLSQYNIAIAHLVLHAMYKAGLFLAAGSVLHALGDQQDFRKFGGLVKVLPVTYVVMLIASLSLAALPWLSGYYSKDLIIELAYGSYTSLGYLVYLLATIAACFTMLYSVKLLYLTFLTYANAPKGNYEKAHESPWVMTLPLVILGVLSVYLGNITRDYFMGLGSHGFGNSIFTHPNHIILIDTEFGVPTLNKLLPLILSVIFAIIALYLLERKPLLLLQLNTSRIGQNIYRFFNQRYWLELIYNRCIVKGTLYLGYITNTVLDRGVFELIGPRGAVAGIYKISNYFASFDSGSIARYAFVMFSGLLFTLITWILFANPQSIIMENYISNIINIKPAFIHNIYYNSIIKYMSFLNSINILYYLLFPYLKQEVLVPGYGILLVKNGDNQFNTSSNENNNNGGGSGSFSGTNRHSAPPILNSNNTYPTDGTMNTNPLNSRDSAEPMDTTEPQYTRKEKESMSDEGNSMDTRESPKPTNQTKPANSEDRLVGSDLSIEAMDVDENPNDSSFNGRYSPISENMTYEEAYQTALKRSRQDKELDSDDADDKYGRAAKRVKEEITYSGKGKEPDYEFSDDESMSEGPNKNTKETLPKEDTYYYDPYQPGPSNIKGRLKSDQPKSNIDNLKEPLSRSPSRNSDFSTSEISDFNSEISISDQKNKDEEHQALKYSEELMKDEHKADKNFINRSNQIRDKYSYNYDCEEEEVEKSYARQAKRALQEEERKRSNELDNSDQNTKNKDENKLLREETAKSQNKNERDKSDNSNNENSEISNSIESIESNKIENFQDSYLPYLMKENPITIIIEKLLKFMERCQIYNLENADQMWFLNVLVHLTSDIKSLIINSSIIIILTSSISWYFRLWPWVIKLKEYLEVQNTIKRR